MVFRLKHHNGTYYRNFVQGFGPVFGATASEAATFGTKDEAAMEFRRHWAMGDCDIEESQP